MVKKSWREKMEAQGVTHKDCASCGEYTHFDDFPLDVQKRDGMSSSCRFCRKDVCAASYKRNKPQYQKYHQQHRDKRVAAMRVRHTKDYRRNRAKGLIRRIGVRAARKGLAFDLDQYHEEVQSIIDEGFCQLTGLPFDLEAKQGFYSPSIDRVKPNRGYVRSNIRVVCHGVNCAMGAWGEDVLREAMLRWLTGDKNG